MTTFITHDHDLDDVCALLDRFIAESTYRRDVKPSGVARVLADPRTLAIVAYRDGQAVGLLMGIEWEHPMFTGKPVSDMVVYVVPEHRGGSIALRMIRMLEAWARERGAEGVLLGQSTGIGDTDRVRRFYERLGYRVTGCNLLKEF